MKNSFIVFIIFFTVYTFIIKNFITFKFIIFYILLWHSSSLILKFLINFFYLLIKSIQQFLIIFLWIKFLFPKVTFSSLPKILEIPILILNFKYSKESVYDIKCLEIFFSNKRLQTKMLIDFFYLKNYRIFIFA